MKDWQGMFPRIGHQLSLISCNTLPLSRPKSGRPENSSEVRPGSAVFQDIGMGCLKTSA